MNRRSLTVAVFVLVILGIVGALLVTRRPAPPVGSLVGSGVGGPFTLVNQDGHSVTERTYAGKFRLMYFGYTFCPDVCPIDVQKIAQGLKAFAAKDSTRADKVVAMFITVDPERDTSPVMKTFVRAFSPTMVGLTGTPAQIDAARKAFRIYARKAGEGPNYLVDHSATIYLMDPDNHPVSFLDHDATPQAIAAELDTYVR